MDVNFSISHWNICLKYSIKFLYPFRIFKTKWSNSVHVNVYKHLHQILKEKFQVFAALHPYIIEKSIIIPTKHTESTYTGGNLQWSRDTRLLKQLILNSHTGSYNFHMFLRRSFTYYLSPTDRFSISALFIPIDGALVCV